MITLNLLATIAIALLGLYVLWFFFTNRTRKGEPPMVTAYIPYMGSAFQYGTNPLKFLQKARKKYGDTFTLLLAGKRITFFLNPNDAGIIFRKQKLLKFEDVAQDIGEKCFQYGPKLSEDLESWFHKSYRQYLMGEELGNISNDMQKNLEEFLNECIPKTNMVSEDLWKFCHKMIFDCSLDTIFGENFEVAQLEKNFEQYDKYFPLLVAGVPIKFISDANSALKELEKQMTKQSERKTSSELVKMRELKMKHLPQGERNRRQVAFLWATMGNTIPAIFWSLFRIYTEKSVKEALEKELVDVVRKKDGYGEWNIGDKLPLLSVQDMKSLVLLESAVMESMRLSVGSATIRKVEMSTKISFTNNQKWSLNKGDLCMLYPPVTHFDEQYFEKPNEFCPWRFLETNSGKTNLSKSPFEKDTKQQPSLRRFMGTVKKVPRTVAYMPFGGGVSMCPGRLFAMNEVKLATVSLLNKAEIQIAGKVPDLDQTRAGLGVIHPTTKVHMFMRAKKPSF
mmetsp:Transcript_20033/g.30000  ORF Transcript_20033/g.30000 Transcript_20033/m.30000 type:complete len:508 (+) Transcript_20033:112-1635(+)